MLKINNYSLEEGEQSVFDSELAGRSQKESSRNERQRAGVDYDNQGMCQVCWNPGDLICCDFCPGAYHPECIGIENVDDLPHQWSCPHHRCTLCERRANAAGGLLFRCTDCPKAYCEDHLPLDSELLGGEVERLMKLGYGAVKQACYCLCSGPCKELKLEHEEREAMGEEGDGEEDDDEDEDEDDEDEDGEEGDDGEEDEEAEGLRLAIEENAAPKSLSVGMQCEVASQEEGELGSWYPVEITSIWGSKATIKHLELTDEDDEPVVEKVKLAHLRPAPPEEPPDGFIEALKPGTLAELAYLGGYWEVSVAKVQPNGKIQVIASRYDKKHSLKAEEHGNLRPGWHWEAGVGHWQQRGPWVSDGGGAQQ